MKKASEPVRVVGRRQLDRRLARIAEALDALDPPRNGWVATLRKALGMTHSQLARRLGVSRQALAQLERRESDGSATLNALAAAADALGGRFVWAIVPHKPLSETLEERAYEVAREMTASVKHTMRLEDQETGSDTERRVRELAEELMASPARLWAMPDAL